MTGRQVIRTKQLQNNLKEMGGYQKLKQKALRQLYVENSLYKMLWTCCETDYIMNE